MAAAGGAAKRQQQELVDCRKWGRYLGRIYRGKNKKTVVVVQVYFPDAHYSSTSKAESYSQLLGAKAALVTPGTTALEGLSPASRRAQSTSLLGALAAGSSADLPPHATAQTLRDSSSDEVMVVRATLVLAQFGVAVFRVTD